MSMRFTGERVIPEMPEMRVTFLQSLAAYVFVEEFLRHAQEDHVKTPDRGPRGGKFHRVLDCGSGEGYGIARLTQLAPVGVGLDQDPVAATWASKKYDDRSNATGLSFVAGGAEALPFQGGSFDAVTCFQVLEHLPDPVASLSEMRRVLAPGGRLFLTTPNRLVTGARPNPHHAHDYTADELQSLLRDVFQRVDMRGVFGSERVLRYRAANDRMVNRVMRLDPLGLRRLLPERVLSTLHVGSTRAIRRWLNRQTNDDLEEISIADFSVQSGDLDRSIDLFAICHV